MPKAFALALPLLTRSDQQCKKMLAGYAGTVIVLQESSERWVGIPQPGKLEEMARWRLSRCATWRKDVLCSSRNPVAVGHPGVYPGGVASGHGADDRVGDGVWGLIDLLGAVLKLNFPG
jgi:hypothetical protein